VAFFGTYTTAQTFQEKKFGKNVEKINKIFFYFIKKKFNKNIKINLNIRK